MSISPMHAASPATVSHSGLDSGRVSGSYRTLSLLIAITLIGGLLRVYRIGDKGLWLDEAFSVWLGWHSLVDLYGWIVRIDQHPPLYYTLLHLWMWLGDSEATVRSLSALFGTVTIPVIFLIGRRISGSGVGLIAALILAVSPFHVRFAQETRMYTLLTFNASVAILALVYLLSDRRSATMMIGAQFLATLRSWPGARSSPAGATSRLGGLSTDVAWLGYVVFTVAAMLSHNTAILFAVAVNLFVAGLLVVRRRWPQHFAGESILPIGDMKPPSSRNWLLAQCGVFLLWLPWLTAFVVQGLGVYREFWIPAPTWRTIVDILQTFLVAFFPSGSHWLQIVWGGFAILTVLGVFHLRKRPATLSFLLVLWLTPLLGEWLVSLFRPILYDRTLIWTTIPLYVLLACGLRQLSYRPAIVAGVAMLCGVMLLSLGNYYQNFRKEEWREAAAYIAQNAQDDDLILFNATWVQIPFDYYFRNYDRSVDRHGAPVDLFARGTLEPKMSEEDLPRLRSLLKDRRRVWLVYSHDWYTDPQKLIPSALSEVLDLGDVQQLYGLEIRQYDAP
jgi:mannosyltransferase